MNHDQSNNQSGLRQNSADDQEHETHTVALILLVVAVLVIVFVVLSFNQSSQNLSPGNYESANTAAPTSSEREPVANQDVDDANTNASGDENASRPEPTSQTSDIPTELIPESADVSENQKLQHQGKTQRLLTLNSPNTPSESYDYYQSWMDENSYNMVLNERPTRLVGKTDTTNLAVSISETDNGSRIRMNYLAN